MTTQIFTVSDDLTEVIRRCSHCHNPLTCEHRYKRCDKCLERWRGYRAKKNAEHEELLKKVFADAKQNNTATTPDEDVAAGKRKATEDGGHDVKKRVKGESKRVKRMEPKKSHFQNAVSILTSGPPTKSNPLVQYSTPNIPPIAQTDGPREYQFASSLYEHLTSLRKTPGLKFNGSYSTIVSDKPSISNSRRVELVSRDLRKTVKLFHDHQNPVHERTATISRCTTSYACECSGKPSAVQASASDGTGSASTLEHSQSGLSRWFPGQSSSSKDKRCGGTIRIRVEDDDSHWLPVVKGQKVTISVFHPE